MNLCARCTMPQGTPGLTFDRGVCSQCRNHSPIAYEGEQKLAELLDAHRRPDRRYDCIVCVSGGRDSSYTLLKIVRDYGMRVLAVNYQSPYTDPQAKKNLENAVRVLNVDLVEFGLPDHLHERTFRDVASAWFRNPSPALIPMICIACKLMYWEILKTARRHDIHCIVNGGNRFEDVSFKKALLGLDASVSAENAITAALGSLIRQSWNCRSYFRPYMIPTLVKGYLFADPYTLGSRIVGRNMERIDLFYFVPWDEKTILSRLRSEIGWESPRDTTSTWRFDCRVGRLKEWMYRTTLGVTERHDFYSKMIREGAMTRDVALQRLKDEEVSVERVEEFLVESGMDPTLLRRVRPKTS